ncbi:hypothetical protein EV1_034766 [Malus domestica]
MKCVFLGYSSTQKGYKCFNPITNKCVVSIDVRFKEETSSFKRDPTSCEGELLCDLFPLPIYTEPLIHEDPVQGSGSHEAQSQSNSQENNDLEATSQFFTHQPSQDVRRNPPRERMAPTKFVDYVTYASRYPISEVISNHSFSNSHIAFLTEVSTLVEPNTFQEANLIPHWRKTMSEELQALEENCTWSIVQLPPRKKAGKSRWVYKTKLKYDGSIERHKVRLVARGFTQTFGVDYKETFAPVAKMNTVRVLLSVVVNRG